MSNNSSQSQILNDPPLRRYWLLLLLLFPVLTIFGNLLVVLSVIKERSLRNATNYFIVSLALADISLAIMVMPLCVWLEVTGGFWEYTELLCDIFIMLDVMFSTASIINLAAISIDRYFAVTQPLKYSRHNNFTRVYITIAITWIISFFIALPIACGLNNTTKRHINECKFNNSNFIIFSSLGSFYIPAVILLILYYRIFKVIQTRAKKSAESNRGRVIHNNNTRDHFKDSIYSLSKENNINQKNEHTIVISNLKKSLIKDRFFNYKDSSSDGRKTISSCQSSSSTNTSDIIVSTIAFGAAHLSINPIIISKSDLNSKKNIKICENNNNNNNNNKHYPLELDSDHDSSTALSDDEGFVPEYIEQMNKKKLKNLLLLAETPHSNGQNFDNELGMQKFRLYQKYRLKLIRRGVPVESVHDIAIEKVRSMRTTLLPVVSLKDSKKKFHNSIHHTFNKKNFSQSIRMISMKSIRKRRFIEKSSAKRERKAIKTLVIVLVIFLVCWVPFFTLNITQAFCLKLDDSKQAAFLCTLTSSELGSITVWLGYINSFLNPIIYTIFNVEFRRAFSKLLHLS